MQRKGAQSGRFSQDPVGCGGQVLVRPPELMVAWLQARLTQRGHLHWSSLSLLQGSLSAVMNRSALHANIGCLER